MEFKKKNKKNNNRYSKSNQEKRKAEYEKNKLIDEKNKLIEEENKYDDIDASKITSEDHYKTRETLERSNINETGKKYMKYLDDQLLIQKIININLNSSKFVTRFIQVLCVDKPGNYGLVCLMYDIKDEELFEELIIKYRAINELIVKLEEYKYKLKFCQWFIQIKYNQLYVNDVVNTRFITIDKEKFKQKYN